MTEVREVTSLVVCGDHVQKEQTFLRDTILVLVSGIFFVSLMMI